VSGGDFLLPRDVSMGPIYGRTPELACCDLHRAYGGEGGN
jgi:hypothetical protein